MTTKYKSIDYDKLKAVYYVGLTGSVTQAGDMMGLCQSAVTKQIQELEKRLNALLFEREDRRMTLTEVGQKVFNSSKFVVENSNALMNDITHSRLCMEGSLHILATPSLANTWLPYYLDGFHQAYPRISLHIRGSLDYLAPIDTDVVITSYRSDAPDFVQLELFTQKLGLFATQSYIERHGLPTSLEELDQHHLIALDRELEKVFPTVNWILKVGKIDIREVRQAKLYLPGHDGVAQAMVNSHGIAALSFHHIKILSRPDIVQILPEITSEEVKYYFIYHKKLNGLKKYQALYDYLKKNLKEKA